MRNQFWGDRYGEVKDSFGFVWAIATHLEDLTPAEIEARRRKAFGGKQSPRTLSCGAQRAKSYLRDSNVVKQFKRHISEKHPNPKKPPERHTKINSRLHVCAFG